MKQVYRQKGLPALSVAAFPSFPTVGAAVGGGGGEEAVEAAGFQHFGGKGRCHVLVELAGLRPGDRAVGEGLDEEDAAKVLGACDRQAVAGPDLAVGLGARPVDVHLAAL